MSPKYPGFDMAFWTGIVFLFVGPTTWMWFATEQYILASFGAVFVASAVLVWFDVRPIGLLLMAWALLAAVAAGVLVVARGFDLMTVAKGAMAVSMAYTFWSWYASPKAVRKVVPAKSLWELEEERIAALKRSV